MLVVGQTNKEIALPLGIEERTVKAHMSKLMQKTGVRNRIALSTFAIKHSILDSE
jgi:DNA-binding NarL/FixJ family response regulator